MSKPIFWDKQENYMYFKMSSAENFNQQAEHYMDHFVNLTNTLQPLYNMVRYSMVLDLTRFKDGSKKCIDYIEKWP